MAKVLVAYYTRSGNTKSMAEMIVEAVKEAGADVDCREFGTFSSSELLAYQGYIFGSPAYYGLPAAPLKQLFDDSVTLHGRLAGRVGAAFASSANIGGGNETTCLAILEMMLVHGMIAVGAAQGDHYGPCGIGTPDSRTTTQCRAHGKRVGELAVKLFG